MATTGAKHGPSTEKVEKVAALEARIRDSEALLLADYRGLSVVDSKELRTNLREADAAFAIVKNTLMRLAADRAGIEALGEFLEGPTAVTFVRGDAVLAAKRLLDAQRRFPALEIKGGYMEGRILSADEAKTLARLESREAMLSKIAGMAKAEMSRAASGFGSLQRRFLGLLDAYKDKIPQTEEKPDGTEAKQPDKVDEQQPDEVEDGKE